MVRSEAWPCPALYHHAPCYWVERQQRVLPDPVEREGGATRGFTATVSVPCPPVYTTTRMRRKLTSTSYSEPDQPDRLLRPWVTAPPFQNIKGQYCMIILSSPLKLPVVKAPSNSRTYILKAPTYPRYQRELYYSYSKLAQAK